MRRLLPETVIGLRRFLPPSSFCHTNYVHPAAPQFVLEVNHVYNDSKIVLNDHVNISAGGFWKVLEFCGLRTVAINSALLDIRKGVREI